MLQNFTVDSDMLVTFQQHQVWQHLVPHSSPVWSHEETAVAKHTFHRCRCSRCTEDFLKQAVQDGELCFLLHSFPRICREIYWRTKPKSFFTVSKQVPSDYTGGHGHISTSPFKVFDSRPKTRTIRLLCKAKAKDLASEAKAKDYSFKAKATISWPRGSSRPRPRPRGLHLCV